MSFSVDEKIMSAAVPWARRRLVTGTEFRAWITDASTVDQVFPRARWSGRTRRIVAREAVTKSRSQKIQDPIEPSSLDPWAEPTPELKKKTLQLTQCGTCHGAKSVTCPVCDGNAVVVCDFCDGSGKVSSPKTGKPINCRRCRGTGQRACACRTGRVRCENCEGKGKVDRWLEVEEEPFQRVAHGELNELARVLDSPTASEDFNHGQEQYNLDLDTTWSGPSVEEAPQEVAAWFEEHDLFATIDTREDRTEHIDLQIFTGQIHRVRYRFGGAEGELAVGGKSPKAVEGTTSRGPTRRRLVMLAAGAFASLLTGASIAGHYEGQHAYFSGTTISAWLWTLAFIAPLVSIPFVAIAGLPGALSRPKLLWPSAGLLGMLFTLAAVLSQYGGPSTHRAQALLKAGKAAQATVEISACLDLDIHRKEALVLRDQMYLAGIKGPVKNAVAAFSHPLHSPAVKQRAQKKLLAIASEDVRKRLKQQDLDGAARILGLVPFEIASDPQIAQLRAELSLRRAERCLRKRDGACILKNLTGIPGVAKKWKLYRSLKVQGHLFRAEQCGASLSANCVSSELRSAEQAGALAVALQRVRQGAQRIPAAKISQMKNTLPEKATLEDCIRLCKQMKVVFEFQAKIGKTEAGGTALVSPVERKCLRFPKVLKKFQRSEERRERYARARCCDGTLSPSCSCGGGRGCCSHHGGVCGCGFRSRPTPRCKF